MEKRKPGILHGEVIDTRDVITFQGKSVDELRQAFRDSVDEYLKVCAERNREPDKSFSGRVVLRMEPDFHRAAVTAAQVWRDEPELTDSERDQRRMV